MKKIRLFATVRAEVGEKYITVPFESGGTVRDLIDQIIARYPTLGGKMLDEAGELTSAVHVFVHGRNIEWLDGLDTVITESDEVFLMPPTAGG